MRTHWLRRVDSLGTLRRIFSASETISYRQNFGYGRYLTRPSGAGQDSLRRAYIGKAEQGKALVSISPDQGARHG